MVKKSFKNRRVIQWHVAVILSNVVFMVTAVWGGNRSSFTTVWIKLLCTMIVYSGKNRFSLQWKQEGTVKAVKNTTCKWSFYNRVTCSILPVKCSLDNCGSTTWWTFGKLEHKGTAEVLERSRSPPRSQRRSRYARSVAKFRATFRPL